MTAPERPAGPAWRPIVAALVNDAARTAYARLVLGQSADEAFAGLSPSRRRHVLEALRAAGLVGDAGGVPVATTAGLRAALDADRPARATGAERFLGPDGRIRQYPSRAADRAALLGLVADRVLAADEVLSERELGERLAALTSDVALLRRRLVDAGLVARTPDGSAYRRS